MLKHWFPYLLHLMYAWHLADPDDSLPTKGPISVCSGASASVLYPGTCGGAAIVNMKSFSNHHPVKADAQAEHPPHLMPGTLLDDEESHSKSAWSYRESEEAYGPHNWYKIAPTCKGPNQSPIDIITANALEMGIESPVELAMDDPTGQNVIHGTLINNGKTIEFETNNDSPPVIFSGEITDGEGYLLKQLHLHFGCGMKTGSEHSIDGIRYSGEMHLVFKNMKYGHPQVAMRKKDGLVILAFFFQVKPDAEPNVAFEKLGSNVMYVQFPKQRAPIRGGISLTELIPLLKHGLVNLKRYVYKGSLPTPPCYESVTWVVFHRPINIRSNKFLQTAFGDVGRRMCDNARPSSHVNERLIYKHNVYIHPPTTPTTTTTTLHPIPQFFKNVFEGIEGLVTIPPPAKKSPPPPSPPPPLFTLAPPAPAPPLPTTPHTQLQSPSDGRRFDDVFNGIPFNGSLDVFKSLDKLNPFATTPPPTPPPTTTRPLPISRPESVINPNTFVESLSPWPTKPTTTTPTTPSTPTTPNATNVTTTPCPAAGPQRSPSAIDCFLVVVLGLLASTNLV